MTGHRVLIEELWKPAQPQSEQRHLFLRFVLPVRPSGVMATETRSQTFPDGLLRDWSRTIGTTGTLGTDVSLIRLERSEAVKRLERAAVLPGAKRLNPSIGLREAIWNVWNGIRFW